MIIEDLAQYLSDNSVGTIASNLFIGELPATTGDAIAIVYQYSPDQNKVLDYYEQDIDIWCKNKSAKHGYEKLLNIFRLLHGKGNYEMGDFHIYFSRAIGTILDNDKDEQGNKLYKLTLRFIYRCSLIS